MNRYFVIKIILQNIMDSSITENYLDYNSDQLIRGLKILTAKLKLQSEIFTEDSETEVKKEK